MQAAISTLAKVGTIIRITIFTRRQGYWTFDNGTSTVSISYHDLSIHSVNAVHTRYMEINAEQWCFIMVESHSSKPVRVNEFKVRDNVTHAAGFRLQC